MKSLVLFSYKQPVSGSSFRVGVLEDVRDMRKVQVHSEYRRFDREFRRTDTLWTVRGFKGFAKFYAERVNWAIRIPFLGSLLSWAI